MDPPQPLERMVRRTAIDFETVGEETRGLQPSYVARTLAAGNWDEADQLMIIIGRQADLLEQRDALESTKRFREFAKEAVEQGGRAAHRSIKKGKERIKSVQVVREDGSHPIGGQEATATLLGEWAKLWINETRGATEMAENWKIDEAEALEPITTEDVKEACLKFSPRTGLGWDKFHPRL